MVGGLTTVTEISPIVQFLIALIGLGVSIDYSLLIVVRWREERAHGLTGDEAVQRAMETAGRAVVFSGTTVAIGLLALIALPLPFLRSVGYGGMLIPLISVIVALTLLPVVLSTSAQGSTGPICAPTTGPAGPGRHGRSWWCAGAGSPQDAPPWCSPCSCWRRTKLQPGLSNVNTIATEGNAKTGLVELERSGIGSGALLPHEAIVTAGTSPQAVADAMAAVPGIHGAVAPTGPQWQRPGVGLADAFPIPDGSTDAGRETLDRTRTARTPSAPVCAWAGYRPRTRTSSTPCTATSR